VSPALLLLHHRRPGPLATAGCQQSVQHQTTPGSTDAPRSVAKRKSPSIFSSVEELARGSTADTQPSPEMTSPSFCPGHVSSTQQLRSPGLMLDLSSDTGYGDSALLCDDVITSGRDVTLGLDRAPNVMSVSTDDVVNMADFRLTSLDPVASSPASALRHRSVCVSGTGCLATGAVSKTGPNEKLHPGAGEASASLSAAMETVSPPPEQQLNRGGFDARNPQIMPQNNPRLIDGSSNVENKQLINGGFALRNPLLTRDADSCNATPVSLQLQPPQNFGTDGKSTRLRAVYYQLDLSHLRQGSYSVCVSVGLCVCANYLAEAENEC